MMSSVSVENLVKTFGSTRAVNDVSFAVEPGEIFGLLGPNGAGKTTILRIILDIFKPDSGKVSILGGDMSEAKKNKIGYLPEERGLYQDIPLERCLTYLATLKGLSTGEAHKRINDYFERFDLADHRRKKIKELSKGMQQKAQLIATLIHQPDLVIIDEPFSALDPVNTQMVKDLLRDEKAKGRTIIMCTHQMHQVEELADRLVLIDHGQVVLYGVLNEIRRSFAGREVKVRALSALPRFIAGVISMEQTNGVTLMKLAKGTPPQNVLQELVAQCVKIEAFEIAMPDLDEIFIRVVKKEVPAEEKPRL
jgi:ABC-2 type transport system ATP-binding protein